MRPVLCVVAVLAVGCSRSDALYQGHPVGHWREATKSDDVHERIEAVAALGELKHRDALPELIAALQDANDSVRAKAAAALWGFGAAARDAAPGLTTALKDKHVDVRMNAAGGVGGHRQQRSWRGRGPL